MRLLLNLLAPLWRHSRKRESDTAGRKMTYNIQTVLQTLTTFLFSLDTRTCEKSETCTLSSFTIFTFSCAIENLKWIYNLSSITS